MTVERLATGRAFHDAAPSTFLTDRVDQRVHRKASHGSGRTACRHPRRLDGDFTGVRPVLSTPVTFPGHSTGVLRQATLALS